MFEEKIKELVRLRMMFEDYKITYQQAILNVDNSDAGNNYKGSKGELERLETEIRQEAESNFKATGEKNPHPAVEIKEFPIFTYDYGTALDYASRELKVAIVPPSLDKKVFEKQIRALPEEKIPTFIEVTKVGKATIKKDLSEFLNN